MTSILAFNITHDSAVTYLEDGKVKFFCKEERLSKTKKDSHPFKSLELFKLLGYQPDHVLYMTPSNVEPNIFTTYSAYIRKQFNRPLENYSSLNHHACHAAAAFYNSTFDQALVFVIDRNGSIFFVDGKATAREAESVFLASKEQGFQPIHKNFYLEVDESFRSVVETKVKSYYPETCDVYARSAYGIVTVYEAATTLIGQSPLENGKVMGLSSYCKQESFSELFYNNFADSKFFIKDLERIRPHLSHLGTCFFDEVDKITDHVTVENYAYYAAKSKHVQIKTQEAALNLIKKYVEKTGIKKVCVAGGYGLNVVANNYYVKNLPDVEFYFEPCCDDTGVSLGGAMLKYNEITQKIPIPLTDNFYHYYDSTENLVQLGKSSTIEEVCNLLIDQKSVAIFEGAPEAGPRALGHRSILFDPRNKEAKNLVNQIKKREWYRPFAGIILKEHFTEYFETLGLDDSKFMTVNFEALSRTVDLVPGIIHVDKSCRIQTVSDGFLYEVLLMFYKKTGCPMLLNTSFNLAGHPLVQTKKDAFDTFDNSLLDALFFVDDMTVYKKL
jgi:carbamoyltransferase